MQISNLALEQHLASHTPQYYLLCGSESLLIEESRKTIAAHLFAQNNIIEKELITFENKDKALQSLIDASNTASLFCQKKLIICLVDVSLKPEERKVLGTLLGKLPETYYLLMQFDKIPTPQQKEAWYQHFLQHGIVVPHWPLSLVQYKQYLSQQAIKRGIVLSSGALTTLTQITEGHALAGVQALEKLLLLSDEGKIQKNQSITENELLAAINQQSRYTLNDLYTAILENNTEKTYQIIENFEVTKMPLALVIWGLHQLTSALFAHHFSNSGLYGFPVLPKTNIFQSLIHKNQKILTKSTGIYLINQLHKLDIKLKSFQADQGWQDCLTFCLYFTRPTPPPL